MKVAFDSLQDALSGRADSSGGGGRAFGLGQRYWRGFGRGARVVVRSKPKRHPEAMPGNSIDAVIEAYKRDIDRTLLRESLALTPDQRVRRLIESLRVAEELRRAMKAAS